MPGTGILPHSMWSSGVDYQDSHAPRSMEIYELDGVHVPCLGLDFSLEDNASASEANDILQTLEMNDQDLFY